MKGIVFFKTRQLETLHQFYVDRIGCRLWLDQGGCQIFKAGNLLFGFCQRDKAETEGIITFYYESRGMVDDAYERFREIAMEPPRENPRYRIYHFFARDPEGRLVEFQYFLDPPAD